MTLNDVANLLRMSVHLPTLDVAHTKYDPGLLLKVYEQKHVARVFWYLVDNVFLKCIIIFNQISKLADRSFYPQGTGRK